MDSDQMRLDVELFIDKGLKEGWRGWPLKSRGFGQAEVHCWRQVGHPEQNRSLMFGPAIEMSAVRRKAKKLPQACYRFRDSATILSERPCSRLCSHASIDLQGNDPAGEPFVSGLFLLSPSDSRSRG